MTHLLRVGWRNTGEDTFLCSDIRFWRVFFFVIINNTVIDVTSLLHLLSCHINHNISACHRPSSYVPYKGTFVLYDGTFGAPDQGQTLDV